MLSSIKDSLYYVDCVRKKLNESQGLFRSNMPEAFQAEYRKGIEKALAQCSQIENKLLQLQAEETRRLDSQL